MPPDDDENTDATTLGAAASTGIPMSDEVSAEPEQRNNEPAKKSDENQSRSMGDKSRENIILSDEGVYSFPF